MRVDPALWQPESSVCRESGRVFGDPRHGGGQIRAAAGGSGNGGNAGNGGETDENQLIIDGLKDISLEEAVKLAQESGYPEEEYQKFAKKQKLMAAYLIKKFKESITTKTAEVKAEDADTSKVDETKVDVDDQSGDQVQ